MRTGDLVYREAPRTLQSTVLRGSVFPLMQALLEPVCGGKRRPKRPIAIVIDGLREGACVHGASANQPKDLHDMIR